MTTDTPFAALATIFRELVQGSPDSSARTYVLNRGDAGLLASLTQLSSDAASATRDGGPSIAAHADHLRYGLSLLNSWAEGIPPASQETDWTASWRRIVVTDGEWKALLDALRQEALLWEVRLRTHREGTEVEAGWLIGSVAHLAYHFGAIRQLNRAARGPTAEDEARAEAAPGLSGAAREDVGAGRPHDSRE